MNNRGLTRLLAVLLAGLPAFLANPALAQIREGGAEAATLQWVGTWSSAQQPATPASQITDPEFTNRTLRQIVHVSLGGNRLRVRLSNAYGKAPLVIGEAQVALQQSGASTVIGSNRVLTFNGQAGITVPAGATVVSDPVALQVPKLSNLSVSVYLPQPTPAATQHQQSRQTSYVSAPGNYVGAVDQPGVFSSRCDNGTNPLTCSSHWYFLAGVDVEQTVPTAAVVALGDSITNATHTGTNKNRRWTDTLARRLVADNRSVGVLNAGIGGNTLVAWGVGPNAQKRFERDVLSQPGARYVIVLIGINDIKKNFSADSLIAGYRALITQARAKGMKIYGATLTPYGRATNEQETHRQAVNRWIRTSGEYDAVIDFDALLRDPANVRRLLPLYDVGDSLHPNNAGHDAMGNAIKLSLF